MKARAVVKWLGLAGVAGVAATGALVAKGERQRRAVTPDQVRDRLRARAQAPPAEPGAGSDPHRS